MILSSTNIIRQYAERYFSEAKGGTKFEFCYPPIHSLIADKVTVSEREDRICIISRFYPRHKNSHRICEVLCEEMAGVEVALIDGANGIDRNTEWYFTQACHRYNARFRYESCVTEEEKFALLKSAKLTIFPSVFEGFGLPPVESLYCGTPCVAFDLPVLREVNGDGVVYARKEDFDDLRSKVIDVLRRVDGRGVPENKAKYKGLFSDFSNRIDEVIQKVL
jgi:glycosyltransferase involved in cell wall biosynthesis